MGFLPYAIVFYIQIIQCESFFQSCFGSEALKAIRNAVVHTPKGELLFAFLSSLRLVHIYTCPRFMFNVWRGTMKSAARVSRSYIAADGDVIIIMC